MNRNFFTWDRWVRDTRSEITRSKVLHVAGTDLYGIVFETEMRERADFNRPLFSTEQDYTEETVIKEWGTLCMVVIQRAEKTLLTKDLQVFTVTQTKGESLLKSFHTAQASTPYEGRNFVNSTIIAIQNTGIVPIEIHDLENVEDLWAEADFFLTGILPIGKSFPNSEEVMQSLPVGAEVIGTAMTIEDLRIGLAKALAEEKLDALYGDLDYLLEAIARDLLEGRMDVGVNIQTLTIDEILEKLVDLAGGKNE